MASLDSLARATLLEVGHVQALARRHRHVRGLRRARRVLDLVDAGAESPQETRLWLMLVDEGFSTPQPQIPVLGPDGQPCYYLDMGREDLMVAIRTAPSTRRTSSGWSTSPPSAGSSYA